MKAVTIVHKSEAGKANLYCRAVGEALPASIHNSQCVQDRKTGYIKTDDTVSLGVGVMDGLKKALCTGPRAI